MSLPAPVLAGEEPLAGRRRPGAWPWQVAAAALVGVVAGGLVAAGAGVVVLVLVVAVPVLVLMHRRPMACAVLWLAATPLVVVTERVPIRMAFWLVHRLLPLAAVLLVLVLRPLIYERARLGPRFGPPEWLAIGFVVATTVSILTVSASPAPSAILFYDRIAAPVLLYLLLRLLRPDPAEVRRWIVPVVLGVLVVQMAIGLAAWTVPGLLPPEWLGQLDQRTVGSVASVSVYGVTLILGALVALHRAGGPGPRSHRVASALLFVGATVMIFLTFSRASWLAGALALGGAMVLHRRMFGRVALGFAACLVLLLGSGLLSGQLQFAEQRVSSEAAERSALSRLPVAMASLRMAEERPLTGWGYENFNQFDRQFQTAVAGFYPEKDHSSHNTYLTILAEQGVLGLALFLGPAVWWLARSWTTLRRRRLPERQAQWLVVLWLALLAHVVVNNFSNMQVPFGLGLWWFTLGLVAAAVDGAGPTSAAARSRGGPG
jgi:putative inorganic carbon (HCO3(-)) transporter